MDKLACALCVCYSWYRSIGITSSTISNMNERIEEMVAEKREKHPNISGDEIQFYRLGLQEMYLELSAAIH